MPDRPAVPAPSTDPAYERCGNCTRERVAADLFWHEADRSWYCNAPFGCEARLAYQLRRGYDEDIARIQERPDASGVTWYGVPDR